MRSVEDILPITKFQLFLSVLLVSGAFVNPASAKSSLSVGFYDHSCPEVELIIEKELTKKLYPIPHNITIPGTLRLFFHDCAVQGCDGSVLILPTDDNNSERNASINHSLARDAFEVVENAKEALEKECPGIVSCADILAILARNVVVRWGAQSWKVEKGRRDGLISNATEAQLLIPKPNQNISSLISGFQSIGLSTADLVTLSGAHTIGFTHCKEFGSRIPRLNSTIRSKVFASCHYPKIDENSFAPLDHNSPLNFDNNYYQNLLERKGMLLTDHELAFGEDHLSRKLVYRYAQDQQFFFREFAKAMVKLGRVGVKTGNDGEIRRKCSKFND
ncbi:hypothetical protein MKX03_010995 [Papaver bracteatum]|nr:hypothetical protein MKX03_010995 [Papaver bracteatum]